MKYYQNNPVVLYHVYGLQELYLQVIFSILTLYYHLGKDQDKVTVVIYTDSTKTFRKYLKDFPVNYELLTSEMIKEYQGPMNFVHRLKIFVIQECLKKFRNKVLYLDADTYFLRNPLPLIQKISPEVTIMNSDDYDLVEANEFEESNWLMIRKAIKENIFEILGKKIQIPMTTRMWNAGIIGIDYSHLDLFPEVISLTDQIYKINQVFTAEQFAFSYILQKNTKLQSTMDYILHYWPNSWPDPQKILYNYHYSLFFKKFGKLPGNQMVEKAFELTVQRNQLKLPHKSILDRILFRLKIVSEVLLKGRITSKY